MGREGQSPSLTLSSELMFHVTHSRCVTRSHVFPALRRKDGLTEQRSQASNTTAMALGPGRSSLDPVLSLELAGQG